MLRALTLLLAFASPLLNPTRANPVQSDGCIALSLRDIDIESSARLDTPQTRDTTSSPSDSSQIGQRNQYFDTAPEGWAKFESSKKVYEQGAASGEYRPPRFTYRDAPEGAVRRIEGRTFHIKDLTVEVEGFEYLPPFNDLEMQDLFNQAKKNVAGEIRDVRRRLLRRAKGQSIEAELETRSEALIRKEMEHRFNRALEQKFKFKNRGVLGAGLRRINAIDATEPGELFRTFKNFRVEKGELHILTAEEVLLGMQEDRLMELVTAAIADREIARHGSSPWEAVHTRRPETPTPAMLSGVYRVDRIVGMSIRDALRKGEITPALDRKLKAAKQLRDEYDPYLMAIRHHVYGTELGNLDASSKVFPVGFDPNNGNNYLTDGTHIYVVDH